MKHAVAAVLMLAALCGCDRTGKSTAWSDDAPSFSTDIRSAAAPDPDALRQATADEQKIMASAPGYATRKGDTLTIAFDGKPVASFTAPYLTWSYRGVVTLTRPDGKTETLPQVYLEQDEIGFTVLVRRDGSIYLLDQTIVVSPDGRTIANGYGDVMYTDHLHVAEWRGDGPPDDVAFAANCRPLAWQDKDHFTAGCAPSNNVDSFWTTAKVSRAADGSWHLHETREVAAGDPHDPSVATTPLRDEVAGKYYVAPQQDIVLAEHNGYVRLAP